MTVRLRLKRLGRKRIPFYRICAMDQRTRRDGPAIEEIGHYNPLAKEESEQVKLNVERAKYWLSAGAQPSDTVRDILRKAGLLEARPANERVNKQRQKTREAREKKKKEES